MQLYIPFSFQSKWCVRLSGQFCFARYVTSWENLYIVGSVGFSQHDYYETKQHMSTFGSRGSEVENADQKLIGLSSICDV